MVPDDAVDVKVRWRGSGGEEAEDGLVGSGAVVSGLGWEDRDVFFVSSRGVVWTTSEWAAVIGLVRSQLDRSTLLLTGSTVETSSSPIGREGYTLGKPRNEWSVIGVMGWVSSV